MLPKLIRCGLYASALTPLIIFGDFLYPFQFGKAIVFRSLVEVLGAAYLILILKNKSYLPRRDIIFWSSLIFTGAFTLTTLTSSIPYISFWGTLERMGGLFTFWHYFVYFIILSSVFTERKYWHTFFNILILAGLASAIYGFGNNDTGRLSGTLGNAALFAGYELFVVFLSLMMLLKSKAKPSRIFYLIAFIMATTAVFMTAVRGSILAYIVGALVLMFLTVRYKNTHTTKIISYSLITLILGFIVFSLFFNDLSFVKNSRYLRRVSNFSLSSPTVQTRFWAWEAGFKGWQKNTKTVFLGYGPENFNIPSAKYFNPKFFIGLTAETFFDRAHNVFVEILTTMGLMGFLTYIGFLGTPFVYLRRLLEKEDLRTYGIGLSAAISAYIVHSFFIFDSLVSFLAFFSLLGFTSYLSGNRQPIASNAPIIKNSTIFKLAAVVIIIFAASLIYKANILPAKANYTASQAVYLSRGGDFDNSLSEFKKSFLYDVPGIYEYRHRFADYLIGAGGPSLKDTGVREAHLFAIGEVDKNIILTNELNHIPYLYNGRLNMNLGENDRALEYLTKALEISPTFVRTYYEIAQVHVNKTNYLQALEYYQKAVDLNPDTGLSYWYLGITKLRLADTGGVNDLTKALAAQNRYVPPLQEYIWLSGLYEKIGDRDALLRAYKHIAGVYAREGYFEESEFFARKAIELDPSVVEEFKIFFRGLGREFNF